MQKKFPLLLFGLVLILLLTSCDRPAIEPSPTANNPPATAAFATADEKLCFACNGSGDVACTNCVEGKMDCPGTCLRLNRGSWVHMEVAGHPPTDLWQKFDLGNGGYSALGQNHVGHVVVFQNGKATDGGPCPICLGKTKILCKVCAGTGRHACLVCGGKKSVPTAWTPTDNPWFNAQPDLLRLKDGRILLGKVVSSIGDDLTVKTRDGKSQNLKASDLLPKPGK